MIQQPSQKPELAEKNQQQKTSHISFSELKKWNSCPYARKLAYGEKIKLFQGNTYTAFGTALHETIESMYSDKPVDSAKDLFLENLKSSFNALNDKDLDEKLAAEMVHQGPPILAPLQQTVQDYFGDFEIFSIEEELYMPTDIVEDYNFKGFIDLVIKTPDGYYNIIDWKSCSWGWNFKRKTDPMTVYQLTLYKNFFAKKYNISPEKIRTFFVLLKRTAKKDRVEILPVTNGKKRTTNALQLLDRAIKNITSGLCVKNRLSCRQCEFYNTEHCN